MPLLVPACRDRLSAGRSYVSRALIMTSAAAMHGAGAPPCSIQLLSSGRAGMGGRWVSYWRKAARLAMAQAHWTTVPWPATPPRREDHACARVPNYLYGASRSRASVSRPCMLHYSDSTAAAAILQYGVSGVQNSSTCETAGQFKDVQARGGRTSCRTVQCVRRY